ncbi:protein serine/threonine kinase [Entamoeba marina]
MLSIALFCEREFVTETCFNTTLYCDFYSTDGNCLVCSNGYYLNNNACVLCSNNCKSCNSTSGDCYSCDDGYVLSNNQCILESVCLTAVNGQCLVCDKTIPLNGSCSTSSDVNCLEFFSNGTCSICNNGYYNNGSICVLSQNSTCENNFVYSSTEKQCIQCTTFDINCNTCTESQCILCNDGYILTNDLKCISAGSCSNVDGNKCYCNSQFASNGTTCYSVDHCSSYSINKCAKCESGYILDIQFNSCKQNSVENCKEYVNGHCLRCEDSYYLTSNKQCDKCLDMCETCSQSDECLSCHDGYHLNNGKCISVVNNCKVIIDGFTCGLCNDGYYKMSEGCTECPEGCSLCYSAEKCYGCSSLYYLTINNTCSLKSDIVGCSTEITQEGCADCDIGYYYSLRTCSKCQDICESCLDDQSCETCINGYILKESSCVPKSEVQSCKSTENSQCSECYFGYKLSEDKTKCEIVVSWWVYIVVGVTFLIVFALIILFSVKITRMVKDNRNRAYDKNTFTISKSLIEFTPLDGKTIPIKQETSFDLNIGNEGNEIIDVILPQNQSVLMNKYLIRTEPEGVILRPGKAFRFRVFVQPLCSCEINETVDIIVANHKSKHPQKVPIGIKFETQLNSSNLDWDEVKRESLITETSNCVVYKGLYRSYDVIIKDRKITAKTFTEIQKFNKEVVNLCWGSCDYLVYFFGAIVNLEMNTIVYEYTPYGSVVNLSDYGSNPNNESKQQNADYLPLQPEFIPPEILANSKYTEFSDIYSLSLVFYHIWIWSELYPKASFPYSWDIIEFVVSGHRFDKPKDMEPSLYEMLSNMWTADPLERIRLRIEQTM